MSTAKKEKELLQAVEQYNSKEDFDLIAAAITKLRQLDSQIFHSEAKIMENLECANILAGLNAYPNTIIAALLSSKLLEKKHLEEIKNEFGAETEIGRASC